MVPELGSVCERRTVVRTIADVSPSSESCVTSAYKPSKCRLVCHEFLGFAMSLS